MKTIWLCIAFVCACFPAQALPLTKYAGTITGTFETAIPSQYPGTYVGFTWVWDYSYESETIDGRFINSFTGPYLMDLVKTTPIPGTKHWDTPYLSGGIIVENGHITSGSFGFHYMREIDDLNDIGGITSLTTFSFAGGSGSVIFSDPVEVVRTPDAGSTSLLLIIALAATRFFKRK